MNRNKTLTYFLCAFLLLTIGIAKDFKYKVGTSFFNFDKEYWWLKNNNKGLIVSKKNFYIDFELKGQLVDFNSSLFYQDNSKIVLNETFIKYWFKENSFLKIGKYYRDFSVYLNDNLSSGSMLISKNAQPMPKIGFKKFKKINSEFNLNYGMSHGFFDKSGRGFSDFYQKSPFLHEKYIYLTVEKQSYFYGIGLVHEAIWGGASNEYGKFPSGVKDFLKIFISADGKDTDGAHFNALGSHLGIWDFYLIKNLKSKDEERQIKFYYQHFFEDTSSLRFANKIDGLWGVELSNIIPHSSLVLEYLDTSNCCIDPPYQDDNYYSNYQYEAGWTFMNYTLGNPFITNTAAYRDLFKLVHFGFQKKIKKGEVVVKVSRKTSIKDIFKYYSSFSKNISENLYLNLFVVGDGLNSSTGIGFNYNF